MAASEDRMGRAKRRPGAGLQGPRPRMLAGGLSGALLLLAQTAAAQPAGGGAGEGGEILVTAQKRAQSLLDVPVAISVITAEAIARQRIDRIADVAVRVPNVAFSNLGDRSQTRIAIRGVGPIAAGGTANLVGVFIDEFNIAPNISTRTSDPSLFDAERIEVLKGPQGTFFGRNVVGGAISISTVKPDPEAPSGRASLTASSWNSWDVRGAVNLPLGPAAALRVNAALDRSDGWVRNAGPFGKGNASEALGGRAALRLIPADGLVIDLQALVSGQKSTLPGFVPTGFGSVSLALLNGFRPLVPGTPRFPIQPDGAFPANGRTMRTDIGLPASNRTAIVIGRVEAELAPAVRLTNVTGWIDNRYRSEGEGDFTENPSFTVRRDEDMDAVSSETRLAGTSGRLEWLVGVLFARDSNRLYQNSIHLPTDPFLRLYDIAFSVLAGPVCPPAVTGLPGPVPGPCPGFARFRLGVDSSAGFFENVEFRARTRSLALFGNLAVRPVETLTLEAGARWSKDRLRGARTEGPLMVGLAPRPSVPEQKAEFDDLSPRFAAVFRPGRSFSLYALAARGYRSGGFNLSPGDPPFEPETLWNYEGGVRVQTADGTLRASATLFRMDWKNTQVRAQDPITQRQVILNASGSTHEGAEVELTLAPLPAIEVGAAWGWLEARFGEFRNARDLDGQPLDATGLRVPRAPEHSISVHGQLGVPLAERLLLFGRIEYQFRDSFREDVALNDRRLNPAHTLVNLRGGLEAGRWSLIGFAENVGNEVYRYGTSNLETFLSGAQASIGPRRRFGISAAVRY